MSRLAFGAAWVFSLVFGSYASATPISIDFEGLADSETLSIQYPGLLFSNAIVLSAGISLNEFEIPPLSGYNVASDETGPLRIDFIEPVSSVSAYLTYMAPVTFSAFDVHGTLLVSRPSSATSNLALSGDVGHAPNELLFLRADLISYVILNGSPGGASVYIDNLEYDSGVQSVTTPESGTLSLVLLGILGLARTLPTGRCKDGVGRRHSHASASQFVRWCVPQSKN